MGMRQFRLFLALLILVGCLNLGVTVTPPGPIAERTATTYIGGVSTTGLVLHLPFWAYGSEQSKIWDVSGQGNHGTITGATPALIPILGPNLVTNGTMEAGQADGDELVTNGGVDSDTTEWTGVNATIASVAGGQAGNCLELTRTGGTSQYVFQGPFAVISGHYYRATLYAKSGTSNDESYVLRIRKGDDSGDDATTGGLITTTSSWVKRELVFKASQNSIYVVAEKNTATAGTMLFDSVSVKECFPPTGWLSDSSPTAVDRSSVQAKTGTYSAHLSGPYLARLYRALSVTAGRTYKLSYWYFLVSGRLYVQGGDVPYAAEHTTLGSWQYAEGVAGDANGYVGFYASGGAAEFYIDDVQLREVLGYQGIGWAFDGVDDKVDAGDCDNSITSEMTWLAWVYVPASNEVFSGIFGQMDFAAVKGWALNCAANCASLSPYVVTDVSGGFSSGNWPIQNDHWLPIFFRYKSGEAVTYGTIESPIVSLVWSGILIRADTATLKFGVNDQWNSYGQVMFGDFLLFNRALSAQEIQQYYENTRWRYGR